MSGGADHNRNDTEPRFTGCCPSCGSGELRYHREPAADGSRRLRAACRQCGADAGSPPAGRGFEAAAAADAQLAIEEITR